MQRTGWIVTAAAAIEMAIIVGQAAVGHRSHYNTDTPLSAALWGTMGATIVVLWLATLAVALRFLREPGRDRAADDRDPAGPRRRADRAGRGLPHGDRTAHTRSACPTADRGFRFVGWSTTGGDLRIAHFVGMHALQGLPLLAAALVATRRSPRRRAPARPEVAAAAWAGLVVLLTWQALRAQPLLAPDATTLAALGALVAATVAAVAAALAADRRAAAPRARLTAPRRATTPGGRRPPGAAVPSPAAAGSRATTRSPPPSGDSRRSDPPASSTVRAAIARPSPEPSTLLCDGLRQKRSVARSSSSGRQTRAGVADRDLHPAVAPRGVHRDRVARRGELHRVVEHGVQHGLDRADRRGDREARLPVAAPAAARCARPAAARPRPGRPPRRRRRRRPAARSARCGPARAGRRAAAESRSASSSAAPWSSAACAVDVSVQVRQPQPQRGQRVAQLVAGVGDERALRGERAGHGLGHAVERHGEPAQLRRPAVVGDGLGRAAREDGRRDPAGALVEPAHRVQDPADDRQGHEHAQRERQQHRRRDQRPRLQLALVQRGRWARR